MVSIFKNSRSGRLVFAMAAAFFALTIAATRAGAADKLDLAWPTPNTAFFEGKSIEAFIQPTASGIVESGLFGGVREGGRRFHEGIDLKPLKRDKKGEPTDEIFAVLPGVVRYINIIPGNSNYGRYIVLEHTGVTPAVYSLYAHLSAVQSGLKIGDEVSRGQRIGTLGRSSDTIAIPQARAHLHLEFGVRVTDDFQGWYNAQKFGSKNTHGLWNGMNLMGFDPLDFFKKWRAGSVVDFRGYFAQMTQAVRVRVVTAKVPDYVKRYPSLLTKPMPAEGTLTGWEIAFNETAIPFSWTPLTALDTIGGLPNDVRVLAYDEAVLKAWKCRSLVVTRGAMPKPGRDLQMSLDLLFGR